MSAGVVVLVGLLSLASTAAVRAAATTSRRAVVGRRLALAQSGPIGLRRLVAWAPPPPDWVARRLVASGVIDGTGLWAGWLVALATGVPTAVLVGGPGLAVVVAAAAVGAPVGAMLVTSGRADRLLEQGLPDALEGMARSLRTSASLRQAVEEAGGTTPGLLGDDLRGVAVEVANGEALANALDAWGGRRPLPGVRLAVSALGLGAETGGAHARSLDGVAATIRSRMAVGREVRALSSQARLSGVVITLAPLGFSALAAATDDRTAGFLLRTPLGLVCLTAGLVLDGVAALWMHRLSKVEL
ncbi:MAG: type II secretion system F family protein [Acidimicrobiales bacterium]